MFTAGAKTTSLPLLLDLVADDLRRGGAATDGSNVEATVIGDGMPVALPWRVPTGPSLK